MGQVYGSSHVNLAATASAAAEGGFFKQRYPIIVNGCRGIFPTINGSAAEEHICVMGDDWQTRVEGGPLNRRGWVTQERMLAPRTLHFTSWQLFWECRGLGFQRRAPFRHQSL
jgi:hypothetical protein